jgi:drug/metabolite transporter (DMT)-like permease
MKTIHFKLFMSAFFWGGSAIAGKIAMVQLSTSLTTFLRFFLAAIFILIVLVIKKENLRISLSQHLKLASLGIIGVSLCYCFYFSGLAASSAFNAGLIEATIPILTLLFATLSGKEKAGMRKTACFLLAYLGVTIIITKMELHTLLNSSYNFGDLMLLMSTVFFGLYNILVKAWPSKVSLLVQMFFIFLYGSLALLPWVTIDFVESQLLQPGAHLSYPCVLAMLFMVIGGSILAYTFFNEGIKEIGAANASSVINFVPVITMIFAMAILGERPVISQWIGAAVILYAVLLANPSPRRVKVRVVE